MEKPSRLAEMPTASTCFLSRPWVGNATLMRRFPSKRRSLFQLCGGDGGGLGGSERVKMTPESPTNKHEMRSPHLGTKTDSKKKNGLVHASSIFFFVFVISGLLSPLFSRFCVGFCGDTFYCTRLELFFHAVALSEHNASI